MLTADIAFVAALILMVGANFHFGPRLGGRVVMQWSLRGNPNWSAPRLAAMWGPLALVVIVRAMIYLAMTYTPDKVHGPEIGVLLFAIIAAAIHIGTLYASVRR